jgi:hypothetical protein
VNPISGVRTQITTDVGITPAAQDVKNTAFRAASDVSLFFQSAIEQIGSKISALSAPVAHVSQFAPPAATTNAAPLVHSQQVQNPVNVRDYGKPHPNVRFAAGVNSQEKFNEVTDIGLPNGTATTWEQHNQAKVARPDPTSYLDPTYIEQHLSLFDQGAVSFITPPGLEKFTVGFNQSVFHGRQEGLFVLPATWAKEMIAEARSDPAVTGQQQGTAEWRHELLKVVEQKMGIPAGCWSSQSTKLLAVFIENPRDLNLRLVNGREQGANVEWRPGGYTLGGVPEAMLDKVPLDQGMGIPFQALEEVLDDRLFSLERIS